MGADAGGEGGCGGVFDVAEEMLDADFFGFFGFDGGGGVQEGFPGFGAILLYIADCGVIDGMSVKWKNESWKAERAG